MRGKSGGGRFQPCHACRRLGIHSRVTQANTPADKPLRLAFIGAGGVLSHQMNHLKPVPHVAAVAVADVTKAR